VDNLFLNIQRLLAVRDIKQGRSYLVNNGFTDNEALVILLENRKKFQFTMLERPRTRFNFPFDEMLYLLNDPKSLWAALSKCLLLDIRYEMRYEV
jgi:hypothetical protein